MEKEDEDFYEIEIDKRFTRDIQTNLIKFVICLEIKKSEKKMTKEEFLHHIETVFKNIISFFEKFFNSYIEKLKKELPQDESIIDGNSRRLLENNIQIVVRDMSRYLPPTFSKKNKLGGLNFIIREGSYIETYYFQDYGINEEFADLFKKIQENHFLEKND